MNSQRHAQFSPNPNTALPAGSLDGSKRVKPIGTGSTKLSRRGAVILNEKPVIKSSSPVNKILQRGIKKVFSTNANAAASKSSRKIKKSELTERRTTKDTEIMSDAFEFNGDSNRPADTSPALLMGKFMDFKSKALVEEAEQERQWRRTLARLHLEREMKRSDSQNSLTSMPWEGIMSTTENNSRIRVSDSS